MKLTVTSFNALTGLGYQFYGMAGLLGSVVTSGITSILHAGLNIYLVDASLPTGAAGILWTASGGFLANEDLAPRLEEASGGGGGSNLSDATIAKLEAAASILLASPYVPSDAPVLIDPAADPDETMTYLDVYDAQFALAPFVVFDFEILTAPSGSAGKSYLQKFAQISNASGRLLQPILKGAKCRVRRGTQGAWVNFTAGSDDSYALPVVLGTP